MNARTEPRRRPAERLRRFAPWLLVALLSSPLAVARDVLHDVVLVVDLPVAPAGSTAYAAAMKAFATKLPPDSHIGLVYAAGPGVEPTTALGPANALELGRSQPIARDKVPQKDPAAALERALYELRVSGRAQAAPSIVLLSDGKAVLADGALATERAQWLRGSLKEEASRNGVRIFVVAWSNGADIALAQSLAAATGGEYFRAANPDTLREALDRVGTALAAGAPSGREAVATAPSHAADRLAGWVLAGVVALGVLLGAISTAMVVRRVKRNPGVGIASAASPQAFLHDLHGSTPLSRYFLGAKPAVIGRSVGQDTRRFDYITVAIKTIGRRHAVIEYREGGHWIADQGSVNGTYVNGQRLTSVHRLRNGDRIRLHHCEFLYEQLGEQSGDRTTPVTDSATRPATQPAAAQTDSAPTALPTTVQATKAADSAVSSPRTQARRPTAMGGSANGPTDADRTVQLPQTTATGIRIAATSVPADARQGSPLDAFISTTLLESARRPDQAAPAPTPPLPRSPPPRTAPENIAVREMSIEDFLKEGVNSEDPFWSTAAGLEVPPAHATTVITQPLDEKLLNESGNEVHIGDTLNFWAGEDAKRREVTTASLEELLREAEHLEALQQQKEQNAAQDKTLKPKDGV